MAEARTAARPYAEAAFEVANDRGTLAAWSDMLALLAGVVSDDRVARLATDPRVGRDRLVELILGLVGTRLDADSGDVPGRTSVAGAPSGEANTAHTMSEATRAPLRVVVDGRLRMPATAQMLRLPGRTLIATTESGGAEERALTDAGAEIIRLPSDGTRVDLAALLRHLAGIGVNELLVEAGAELGGALLRAALVDEIVVYLAPHIMGDQERGLFHLPALAAMADRIALTVTDMRAVGDDWRVQATVTSRES